MATPKKPRHRHKPKGPGETPVPAGVRAFATWEPGQRPPWLDQALDTLIPTDQHAGRNHPKWGEAAQDALIGALAGCGSYKHAAAIAGVSTHTAHQWLARGRADQRAWEERLAAGEPPDDPTEWHVFARAVTLVSAWWAGQHIAELQRMAYDAQNPAQLRAAILQWLLARLGDKLTERVEVEHSGEVMTTPAETAAQMREKFDQIRARYEALGGDGGQEPG